MKSKKATQESIQEHNIGLILKLIKEKKNFTRAKLSAETGLSKSTISSLVDILINKKIVTEGKKIDSERGKKPILLMFNKTYYYIMAINIGIDFITIAISDLCGEIIYRIQKKNHPKSSREKMLNNIFTIIEEALKKSGIDLKKIYLFSIGVHGAVNPVTKCLSLAPYFLKWHGINLVEIFKKKYKKEVILENSVNLGAIGEHWKNYSNINNLIYLYIHYGTAAGIIINNKLIVGNNGTMGEIAYMPILKKYDLKKIKENKPELGLFESQVDIVGITNTVKKELKKKKDNSSTIIDKDIDKINFNDICKYYNCHEDNDVKKIINNEVIKILTIGIASMISVIDTNTIIINGKIIELGEKFINKLKNEIYSISPFKPNIIISNLKNDAPILGEIKFGLNYMNNILYNKFFLL
ncbi:MAG: ROK family protein [Actinobacteria bacterium]|nr:ROK family protein [Actinomycetota bacterium]